MAKINSINQVLQEYFEHNKSKHSIPAKDMMPYFILAGVFEKDTKNGLSIRAVLRRLNAKNELYKIPYALAERKATNTKWYFQRKKITKSILKKIATKKPKKTAKKTNRKNSDEHYVLDLCDEVLGLIGKRQHRFDFLLGDADTKLPVDIYYPTLNLVIEYKEQQHIKPNKHFDKPDKMTVSGVHRGEQRKIYDQRRLDVLPKHGIKVIEIFYSDFNHDSKNRILRSDGDLGRVKGKLKHE